MSIIIEKLINKLRNESEIDKNSNNSDDKSLADILDLDGHPEYDNDSKTFGDKDVFKEKSDDKDNVRSAKLDDLGQVFIIEINKKNLKKFYKFAVQSESAYGYLTCEIDSIKYITVMKEPEDPYTYAWFYLNFTCSEEDVQRFVLEIFEDTSDIDTEVKKEKMRTLIVSSIIVGKAIYSDGINEYEFKSLIAISKVKKSEVNNSVENIKNKVNKKLDNVSDLENKNIKVQDNCDDISSVDNSKEENKNNDTYYIY